MSKFRTRGVWWLSVLAFAACAPAAPPAAAPAPTATMPTAERPVGAPELVVRPEAERVAGRVQPTGTELGSMWTFENPPIEYWQRTYNFTATPEWLEHVRLSSVRYGQICSASFVSPTGLVMTNHHCARDCVEGVSTATQDYLVEGFYAPTRAQELVCPDLHLDQLIEIEDVTERVEVAGPAGAAETELAAAREAVREEIEDECEAAAEDRTCQVVSLFHGGQFKLYEYKRYSPVKLVWAPELQAGFFGGDPDNFTYPRYVLDAAFVRAYEDDGANPARTEHYFRWDTAGAREGEVVFITGNPGSTSRLATVSQVLYQERLYLPFMIQFLEAQRELLQEIASQGPEAERRVRDQLFSIENTLKNWRGQIGGLADSVLVGRKISAEREFQRRVRADPALEREYGEVWNRIAQLQARKVTIEPRLRINNPNFIGDPYTSLAAALVQAAGPGELPPEARQQLLQESRFDPRIAQRLLEMRLRLARAWLPADDPFIRLGFQPGETPEQAAERLIANTRVNDASFRRQILEGQLDLSSVQDPLIQLARHMLSTYTALEPEWETITAGEDVQRSRLAKALFAVYGTDLPPDATFTLRISDGVMRGYPYNGTFAPAKTTYYGLYERAVNFDNAMPWQLPEAFAEARDRIDMSVPLNFVTTNDITGGNSGSPMIDTDARVVGLAFDSNIEGLPNEFLYTETAARTIGVSSAGILEALRSVYDADALVQEILAAAR